MSKNRIQYTRKNENTEEILMMMKWLKYKQEIIISQNTYQSLSLNSIELLRKKKSYPWLDIDER